MILVVGATGKTGSEVIRLLTDKGIAVRALVRSPQKAATIQALGVEIVYGDLSQPETLEASLEGIDKAFLASTPDLCQAELQGNFLDAAKISGVRHIVRLGSISAGPDVPSPLLRMHWDTEQHLQASGIGYTHLRPNFYMQNLLMGSAAKIKAEGKLYAPVKDAKISMVDVRDVAAVTVAALTEAGHEGKLYNITGSAALSFAEIAYKLSVATNKPVTCVPIPIEAFRQNMLALGKSEWIAKSEVEIMKMLERQEGAEVTNVISEVAQKEPITFDQFLQDYAPAFQSELVTP